MEYLKHSCFVFADEPHAGPLARKQSVYWTRLNDDRSRITTLDDPDQLRSVKALKDGWVSFPPTVFMLGGDIDRTDDRIRDLDLKKHLGIGNVLDATPPVWLHLPKFSMAPRMITNGEFAEFVKFEDEQGCFYDAPDLWRHVWTELGYHIDSAQMPYRAADGEVQFYEESYSSCTSFIEAYLQSLFNEIQYVLLGLPEERPTASDAIAGTGGPRLSRDHVVRRIQAFSKYKLRDAMSNDGGSDILTDDDQELLAEYKSLQAALDDVDYITKELKRGYGRQVDHRLQQTFKKGQLVIEPIVFLDRLSAAITPDHRPEDAIPLRKVLYPRKWKSMGGQARGRRLMGTAVPWEACPVTGISFFEALAYASWLSSVSGEVVSLPNEAQFERASSWPLDHDAMNDNPIKLDPRKKLIFPWQDHCKHDFNFFFGREGREVEGYYQKDRRKYKEVIDSTARRVTENRTLYQLEGFGWHWTVDRYSETERKYSRFQDPDYAKLDRPCIEPGGTKTAVYDYSPNRNPKDSFMVLKGSPDVVGGPGLTTRRYATYPLRGYFNVGFRLIREET